MNKTIISVAAAAVIIGSIIPPADASGFIEESKASLDMRNFNFRRDFPDTDNANQNEWAQSFILRMESGFTEGPVGFGVDVLGMVVLNLDSNATAARNGHAVRPSTGLSLVDKETGEAEDEYSKLGLTAKARVSKSVLKMGTLLPRYPVLGYSDSRMVPQTFRGSALTFQEVDHLTVDALRITQVKNRNSSDFEDMQLSSGARRGVNASTSSVKSDGFNVLGGSYAWGDTLSTTYHYAALDDVYHQHFLTLKHSFPIGDKQSLKSDIRFARSNNDGQSNVDNQAFNAMFTYSLGTHAFGLGYQKMSGDTGYAFINGTDPFLVNYVQYNDFANKDEKSWQARYDYDFAGLGIPGLTLTARYLSGDNFSKAADYSDNDGKEWERDIIFAYVIQQGPLKTVGLKWTNSMVRNNYGSGVGSSYRNINENGLIATYSLKIW